MTLIAKSAFGDCQVPLATIIIKELVEDFSLLIHWLTLTAWNSVILPLPVMAKTMS